MFARCSTAAAGILFFVSSILPHFCIISIFPSNPLAIFLPIMYNGGNHISRLHYAGHQRRLP
jgi:hypothetical protein